MKRFAYLLLLAALMGTVVRGAQPVRPIPAAQRVLIISVDGLRPDSLLVARTPVLRSLMAAGAYTFWARTTAVSITLPSHVSMLTAVVPQKHGVDWNRDLPLAGVYPLKPTLFEMATGAGYVSAMVAGKSKFSCLNKPGTLAFSYVPPTTRGSDEEVATEAVRMIAEHRPDVLFVHFPDVDGAGHKFGWGSVEQLAVIEKVDARIGQILEALDRAGVRNATEIFVTSDHGGAGLTHGPDDPRSRHIPWILSGPGVRRNFDLTLQPEVTVNIEDTCATACYLLGLPIPSYFDGRPVLAAFEADQAAAVTKPAAEPVR